MKPIIIISYIVLLRLARDLLFMLEVDYLLTYFEPFAECPSVCREGRQEFPCDQTPGIVVSDTLEASR